MSYDTQRQRLTAPSGGVVKGQGYLIGSLFVVARRTCAEGATFSGATSGKWPLIKTAAQAWTEGQKIYWNIGTSKADSDGTTGPLIGVAAVVAANPSTTGMVRINPSVPAASEGPQAAEADLVDNGGGAAADGTIAAVTAPTALTGTLTGTVNSALVDIAAAAGACAGEATPSATQVDAAIATAVATIVSGTNEQLKELMTAQGQSRTAIVALTDAVKEITTKLNATLAKLRAGGAIAS